MAPVYEVKAFESREEVYSCELPAGEDGEGKLFDLMRLLASTYSRLGGDEIRDNVLGRREELVVKRDGTDRPQWTCEGGLVHVVAKQIEP